MPYSLVLIATRLIDLTTKLIERDRPKNFYKSFLPIFYFLISYGVCKKRKYCNRMIEKKILSL